MQKHILPLFWCYILFSSSVKPATEELKWSSLKEVSAKLKEQQKPVLVNLYTDWCHWCKVMDKKTYADRKVIDYLSEKFYVVKVNAETKELLRWDTKMYTYNSNYRVNEFALYASNGQTAFPTTVILTSEGAVPIPVSGFLKPQELEPILEYFGDRAYLSESFPEFKKKFKSSW